MLCNVIKLVLRKKEGRKEGRKEEKKEGRKEKKKERRKELKIEADSLSDDLIGGCVHQGRKHVCRSVKYEKKRTRTVGHKAILYV